VRRLPYLACILSAISCHLYLLSFSFNKYSLFLLSHITKPPPVFAYPQTRPKLLKGQPECPTAPKGRKYENFYTIIITPKDPPRVSQEYHLSPNLIAISFIKHFLQRNAVGLEVFVSCAIPSHVNSPGRSQ